ncbi:MAG: hypothetical protein DMG53_06660 [Acidobacteria bacterium]|nr:MAG: hypothetical protein DMG53_06660 [Acidobacteriota bacterium]
MKYIRIAIFLFICAQTTLAQHYIVAPIPKADPFLKRPKSFEGHRFDRRMFFVEISLLGAAKTADAISTRQLLNRGGGEGNPIFGRNPSSGKQAGINAGFFIAQSTLFYLTEHNHESATTLEPTAPTSEFVVVALPIVNKTSRRGLQFPVDFG